MISLDTNLILRLLLRDVPEQAIKAEQLIERSSCYLTDVVAAEAVFVLEKVYKFTRNDIAAIFGKLRGIENVECSAFLMDDVLELYQKESTLSIVDCYAVVEAGLFGNDLATFDEKLLKRGGANLIRP